VFGWRLVTDHTVMPIKVREDRFCLVVSDNGIRRIKKHYEKKLVNSPWQPVFQDYLNLSQQLV
jgi:hypothetical protein